MKSKEITNWDLVVKLLNNNQTELHAGEYLHGFSLYITSKHIKHPISQDKIYITSKIKRNQIIKDYVNNMTVYNFMIFYEGLNDLLESIQDSKLKYEKLIKEYQKENLK